MVDSAIRRSKRDRKKTVSYYDDFSGKEGRTRDHEDNNNEDDAESTSSQNDSDVETRPRKSRTPAKKKQKQSDSQAVNKKNSKNPNRTKAAGVLNTNPSRQQAFTALQNLAKKAFPDPKEDSLAYRLIQATEQCTTRKRKGAGSSSFYTEGVQTLVNEILSEGDSIDVALLNLIWRCIGAKTLLSGNIDDWSDEDWMETVDQAVEEIRESDQTLLSASEKPTLGTAEFQKMYTEFWYIMAQTAPVDTLESILARLMELQAAGVTDLRWAICLAVYAVGDAALDSIEDLRNKVSTADRQYKAAKKTKSSRKSGVLKGQLDDWQRKIDELSNVLKESVMVIFTTRYRDASESIRVLSINALGRYVKMNSEFARSMYFKYVGWLLCDRVAAVRRASLLAIKAPFEVEDLDWKGMASVIARYTARIVECTEDVDLQVQEAAMDLLLALFQNDLLEETDTDMWTHLNSRALAKSGTAKFRRDALNLVLGQLSEFDEGSFKSESHAAEQISQLSHWLALEIQSEDTSEDENQQLDGHQVEKVDLIVESLRHMPEHKKLTVHWSAFLRFLQEEERRQTDDRELNTLKQAVVLRMVSKAAESSTSSELEDLTLTMLRILPELLTAYKSETIVLQNLTSLPKFFPEADHARKGNALVCLKDTASTLRSDLSRSIEEEDHDKAKSCLQKLSMLAQRCSLATLLENLEDDPLDQLSKDMYAYAEGQLKARKLEAEDDEARELSVPPIWASLDAECHSNVAQSICFVFDVLMAMMSWELKEVIELIDRHEEPQLSVNELSDNMAIRLRSRALNLAIHCFDLSPANEDYDTWQYSEDQSSFLSVIRIRSLKAYTDICTLFPEGWSKTKSPFLKACAWDPKETVTKAAASKFFWNQVVMANAKDEAENSDRTVDDVALPFVRSVLCTRNRFDLSKAMGVVAGFGKEGQELVFQLIRTMKKPDIAPVLEAQITFLQLEFERWGESEPDEPDDCPTDTQLTDYDADVDEWDKAFQLLLTKATKLASSLGFGGQLRDSKTRAQMLKFIQEGLNFSFRRDGGEEPLHLGVRVPFLFVLAKYGKYVKGHQATSRIVEEFLNKQEKAFRDDPEFESEINLKGREIEALEEYRRSCGFGKFVSSRKAAISLASTKKSKSLPRPRMSTGSSVSSIHSKTSKESSLDPIEEEVEDKGMALPSPDGDGRSGSSRAFFEGSAASTLRTEHEEEGSGSSPDKSSLMASTRNSMKTEEESDEDESALPPSNANDSIASTRKSRMSDIASPASIDGKSIASTQMSRKSASKSVDSRRSEMSLLSPENADDDSVESTIASSMRPSAKTIDTPSSNGNVDESDGSESIGST